MRTFTTEKTGRTIIMHLTKGEDVLASVQTEINRLGYLRCAKLHAITTLEDLPANDYYGCSGPIELGSAQGLIINGEPHFHLTVSDSEKTYTGHMEPGCEVQYLAELAILELSELNIKRASDEFGISYITSADV